MSFLGKLGRFFRGDSSTAAPLALPPAAPALPARWRGDAISLNLGQPAGLMMGGFSNPVTGVGMPGVDSRMASQYRAGWMTDELAIEMWRGDEIAHRIISMLPREALEPGVTLSIQDEEQTVTGQMDTRPAAQLVEDVEAMHRNLRTEAVILRACEWERLFGGAAIWAGANDFRAGDWSEPLDLGAPMMRLQWLDVIRSRDLYPHAYYEDPGHPKYGQVAVWRLSRVTGSGRISQQALIHESRLFLFRGRRIVEDGTIITQNLASAEFGDGIMLAIQPELRRFVEALDNTELAMRANGELVWQHQRLAEILGQEGEGEEFKALVSAMSYAQSILRARVVGADQTLTRQGVSLAGLSELVDKYENRVAGIAGVPRTKLFGEAPGGLGNNGAGPQGDWDETKRVYRKNNQLPAYEWVTRLGMLALGGEPKRWKLEGKPYRQPTEQEKTAQVKEEAGIDVQLMQAQVITVDEVRARPIWRERYSLPDPNAAPALGEVPDDIRAPGGEVLPADPMAEQAGAEAPPSADQPKAADLALNGAQALALAAIVEKVAIGAIPRSSGAELVQFTFKVPPDQAERMMPPAGFTPATVPDDVEQAPPAAATATDARTDSKQRTIDALLKRLAPSGKCAECGKSGSLEVDHVHGRGWDPAEMSAQQRADKYWQEYDNGKKMRALCRECNARDGAKNKQGKSGPEHRGDAITTGANRRFTFAPLPADVAHAMHELQARIMPPGGEAQEIDHITLVYCPSAETDIDECAVSSAVAAMTAVTAKHSPIRAKVQGWAYFDGARKAGEDRTALVALVDAPGITELQVALRAALAEAGMEPSSAHSFSPHFTFCYLPAGGRVEGLPPLPPTEFVIDTVCFVNREVHQLTLIGNADEPVGDEVLDRIDLVTPYQIRALDGEDREALVATLEIVHGIPGELADRLIPEGPGDFGGDDPDDLDDEDDEDDEDDLDDEDLEEDEEDLDDAEDEDLDDLDDEDEEREDADRDDCANPIRGEGGLFEGCEAGSGSGASGGSGSTGKGRSSRAKAPKDFNAIAEKRVFENQFKQFKAGNPSLTRAQFRKQLDDFQRQSIENDRARLSKATPGQVAAENAAEVKRLAPKPEKKKPLTPKQKEAAKKKAIREKEKAKKAREKERAAKAKAREKEKIAKAKAKERARKEKEKARKAAAKAKLAEREKARKERAEARVKAREEKAAARAKAKAEKAAAKAKEREEKAKAKAATKGAKKTLKDKLADAGEINLPAPGAPLDSNGDPITPEFAEYKGSAVRAIAQSRSYWDGWNASPKFEDGSDSGRAADEAEPEAKVAQPGYTYSRVDFYKIRDGYTAKLSNDERDASLYYSHKGDNVLNSTLRTGTFDAPENEDVRRMAASLDSAIEKHRLTEDTKVTRMMSGKWAESFVNAAKVGGSFTEKGYTSTSATTDFIMEEETGVVRLNIRLPKGTKAAPIPSNYPSEGEFLLPRGSRFRIKAIKKTDIGHDLEVELEQ